MKTNQMMKRNFLNASINQRTEDEFFSATDLLNIYNKRTAGKKKKITNFFKLKQTKDFMQELASELNISSRGNYYLPEDMVKTRRGMSGGTYMHPYLFVKFAMWLSPKFEVYAMKWVADNLINYRKQAGDYYKKMCGVINEKYNILTQKNPSPLIFSKEAKFLNRLVFDSESPKSRNEASPKELDLMNRLQLINIELIKQSNGESNPTKTRRRKLAFFAEFYKKSEKNMKVMA